MSDGARTYTTRHNYVGGLYDATEREFRGFRKVEKTLPDSSKVVSWFHQDNVKKGLVEKQETLEKDGRLFKRVQNTYGIRTLGAANFPYLSLKLEHIFDGAPSALTVETSFAYDTYGNMTKKKTRDPVKGQKRLDGTTYTHDTANWIVSRPKVTYTFDTTNVAEDPAAPADCQDGGSTPEPVQKTCYQYRAGTNLLTSKRYWLKGGTNPVVAYDYDDLGNLVTITDANLNPPTTIQYDPQTQTFPHSTINPLGHETIKEYDYRFGKPKSVMDPNTNETLYQYDGFGRLTKMIGPYDPDSPNGTVSYEYLDFGVLGQQRVVTHATTTSGPTGSSIWKRAYFDGLGRVTKTVAQGPEGRAVITSMEYDWRGLVTKRSFPYFSGEPVRYTQFQYDCLGRVTKQINPDQTIVETGHGKLLKTVVDENGHRKDELRDAFGNLREVTQFTGEGRLGSGSFVSYAKTRYSYDVLGNLVETKDAATPANVTTISHDTLSRRKAMADPNMGTWTFGYDANGNLVAQTDGRNTVLAFEYDELNRITAKREGGTGGVVRVTYSYDEPASANSKGRLTTVVDGSGAIGKTTFEYDKMGRTTKVVKTVDDPANPFTTQTAYDALGRVKRITYPGGSVVTYNYDATVLKNVNSTVALTQDGKKSYAVFSGYNAMGQVGKVLYANNVETTYTYDPLTHRLDTLGTTDPALASPSLQNMEYGYDDVGNITSITDFLYSNMSQTFQYDELNRLVFAHRNADNPQVYNYDPAGNITDTTLEGVYAYGASKPYAVKSVTKSSATKSYLYDGNGNMRQRLGRTIVNDYANRPTSIDLDTGKMLMTYDYQGRRVKKTLTQPARKTLYIGKYYECTDGACTSHIFAGNMRIASKTSADTLFYHTDHLGGTNFVTDINGAKKETVRYEPYGATRQDTGTANLPYKFTGQELDAQTGLYYYGARYYDPTIGRFISADPILQAAFDPATFDRLPTHAYLPADPPVYTDKTSHYALENSAIRRSMDSLPGRLRSVDLGAFSEEKVWSRGESLGQAVDVVWVPGSLLNAYAYVQNNPVNLIDPLGLTDCGASNYGGNDGGTGVGTTGNDAANEGVGSQHDTANNGQDVSTDPAPSPPSPAKSRISSTAKGAIVGGFMGGFKGAMQGLSWGSVARGAIEGALVGALAVEANQAYDAIENQASAPNGLNSFDASSTVDARGYADGWPGL